MMDSPGGLSAGRLVRVFNVVVFVVVSKKVGDGTTRKPYENGGDKRCQNTAMIVGQLLRFFVYIDRAFAGPVQNSPANTTRRKIRSQILYIRFYKAICGVP